MTQHAIATEARQWRHAVLYGYIRTCTGKCCCWHTCTSVQGVKPSTSNPLVTDEKWIYKLLGICRTEQYSSSNMWTPLSECNSGTTQKCPCAVSTTIELKSVSTASVNTGTLLSQKQKPLDAITVGGMCCILELKSVLNENGQFLDCVTIAFSERYLIVTVCLCSSLCVMPVCESSK